MTVNQKLFAAIAKVANSKEAKRRGIDGRDIYLRIIGAYLVDHYKKIGQETLIEITDDLNRRGLDYYYDLPVDDSGWIETDSGIDSV